VDASTHLKTMVSPVGKTLPGYYFGGGVRLWSVMVGCANGEGGWGGGVVALCLGGECWQAVREWWCGGGRRSGGVIYLCVRARVGVGRLGVDGQGGFSSL